jgi:hypothetical protein
MFSENQSQEIYEILKPSKQPTLVGVFQMFVCFAKMTQSLQIRFTKVAFRNLHAPLGFSINFDVVGFDAQRISKGIKIKFGLYS